MKAQSFTGGCSVWACGIPVRLQRPPPCCELYNMATADTEQKFLLSESYVKARNDYFHRAIKWFYKDQTPFEVCDMIFKCVLS
jgi:hypothetical protein